MILEIIREKLSKSNQNLVHVQFIMVYFFIRKDEN